MSSLNQEQCEYPPLFVASVEGHLVAFHWARITVLPYASCIISENTTEFLKGQILILFFFNLKKNHTCRLSVPESKLNANNGIQIFNVYNIFFLRIALKR